MLMKICQRCGKRVRQGESCGCKTRRHKLYNEHCRDKSKNDFYHTREWAAIVEVIKARAKGLDEYELSKGRLEVGKTVHHIYPIEERPDLKLSIENLILVSAKNYARIHREYKSLNKAKLQAELTEIVK